MGNGYCICAMENGQVEKYCAVDYMEMRNFERILQKKYSEIGKWSKYKKEYSTVLIPMNGSYIKNSGVDRGRLNRITERMSLDNAIERMKQWPAAEGLLSIIPSIDSKQPITFK